MTPGCTGSVVVVATVKFLEGPVPQVFDGVTVISPAIDPAVTVTELLVPPPVCVHPEGNIQV